MDKEKTLIQQEVAQLSKKILALSETVLDINDHFAKTQTLLESLSRESFQEETSPNDSNSIPIELTSNETPKGELLKFLHSTIRKSFSADEGNEVWLKQPIIPAHRIPPFISTSERDRTGSQTRIISLLNFKGGVGKTTLSANLAAAFASGNFRTDNGFALARPIRVLAVDLDYQGSMTERCRNPFESPQNGSEYLLQKMKDNNEIEKLLLPFISCPNAKLIPADSILDAFDNKVFSYQIFKLFEMRFNYRFWFHQKDFFNNFDLVIFDCPP